MPTIMEISREPSIIGSEENEASAPCYPSLTDDKCACCVLHTKQISLATSNMPSDEKLADLADLFKMFADSTRVRILCALMKADLCVCDIAEALHMTTSAVSHQLRSLRTARLVKNRREGKSIIYSLDDAHIGIIFSQGLAHVSE